MIIAANFSEQFIIGLSPQLLNGQPIRRREIQSFGPIEKTIDAQNISCTGITPPSRSGISKPGKNLSPKKKEFQFTMGLQSLPCTTKATTIVIVTTTILPPQKYQQTSILASIPSFLLSLVVQRSPRAVFAKERSEFQVRGQLTPCYFLR